MNDKDRELIERVLQTAGDAGSKGWEHLTQWHLINGVLSAFGYGALLVLFAYLLRRALNWKPEEEEEAHIARTASIGALVLVSTLAFSELVNSVRDAIAPEGAAIHSALERDAE